MTKRPQLLAAFCVLLFTIILSNQASALYDPGVGRFCSRDPIGYEDGANPYSLQFGLTNLDPTGTVVIRGQTPGHTIEPQCNRPNVHFRWQFGLSVAWPCEGKIGFFVQKVSVSCQVMSCRRPAKKDEGAFRDDFTYYEVFIVKADANGNISFPVDNGIFSTHGRGRYRQSGIVKFYCLDRDGKLEKGEIKDFESPSEWSTPKWHGKGVCQTVSGGLPSKTFPHSETQAPNFWKRPSAANVATRNFSMAWNCCCPEKWVNANANPPPT